jgi:hypothetical protein
MARTERQEIRCTVKEHGDGEPFLFFEADYLRSFPHTYFGLGLKPGTTYAEARQIADVFDRHVASHFALVFEADE